MSDINEKLARLKQDYLKRFPQKIDEIEGIWKELEINWSLEKMTALQRMAHNIRGTSATYGCMTISDIASQIEILLKTNLEASQKQVDKEMMEHLLKKLRESSV